MRGGFSIQTNTHMKNIFAVILSVVLLVSSGVFFFLDTIETGFRRIISGTIEPKPFDAKEFVETVAKEVFTPPPLKKFVKESTVTLSKEKIIQETNRERGKENLPLLSENTFLAQAAEKKLTDMIAQNYFAHVSPAGLGAGDWVERETYKYILVGENLAMGDFISEVDLVTAWMESPGHRANIMNQKYRDIGIAVRRGIIEGRTALIAVQLFGTPVSICPEPDIDIRTAADALDEQLTSLRSRLEKMKLEIDATKNSGDKQKYNALVDEYNEFASRYNGILEETKKLIELYNEGVRAFNACALNI